MSCRVVQNLQVHLVELGHYLGQRKVRRLGGPCRTKPRTQPVILEQAPYRAGQFCGVARLHVHAFDTVGYHIQQTPECRDHTRGACRQAFHSNTPEPLGHHARHNADDGVSPRGDHRLSRDVGRDDDPGTVINPEILAGQTREDQRRIYPLCAEAGVCIKLVGLGEECDASGEDFRSTAPRVCHEQRPPDDDGEYASAFDSLICDASAGDPGSRHCLNDRPDGSACRSNDVCRSGLCLRSNGTNDGVCTAKVANGEPCQSHLECASGACQSSEPRVCGALLADGEACGYEDLACQSGSCTNHANAVCVPPATLAPGESCTASSECMSMGHGDSRDAACQAGRCVADICAEYAE